MPTIAVDPDGKWIFCLLGGAAVVGAVVVTAALLHVLSKLVPDRSKDKQKDTDHLIQDLSNRRHDVDNVRDRVEDIVTKAPGTSLTGPPNLPRKTRDWVMGLLLDCMAE